MFGCRSRDRTEDLSFVRAAFYQTELSGNALSWAGGPRTHNLRLQRPVLYQLALPPNGWGGRIRTDDGDFKGRCLRPLGYAPKDWCEPRWMKPVRVTGLPSKNHSDNANYEQRGREQDDGEHRRRVRGGVGRPHHHVAAQVHTHLLVAAVGVEPTISGL